MPAFQKKTSPFVHQGMYWNASIDRVPDGKIGFARNIRVQAAGQVTGRNGLSNFASVSGISWFHSLSRINNSSAELPLLTSTYVVGGDDKLFIGTNNTDLNNASINPLLTAPSQSAQFSGNPLSMVDCVPYSGASGWKYIGDSNLMCAAGYYPGDTPGTTMARAITIGMLPPVWDPTITTGAGVLDGNYQWACAFRRIFTGARSNPSAASRNTLATPALTLANQAAIFTLPTAPLDPQTGSPDTNIVVDVYRYSNVVPQWAYVGTGNAGSSFTDNNADVNIESAPVAPQITDPTTGVTRFSLSQPFVSLDAARFGTGVASQLANGAWIITWASGPDHFKPGWVQGSFISVADADFTIYQVISDTVVELSEDASVFLTSGDTYAWSTHSGTLTMGKPLPHLWGPYGVGVQGFVIFACGDPEAPGTLYWTNGNDPDSTDQANSLVVTSPSEPLQNGCMFNGQAYVWSTERMFIIQPNLTITGQFTAQEVAGKGLWMPWGLTLQSSEAEDVSISWVGKDGVYNWSSDGAARLTDDLGTYFPRDNEPPIIPTSLSDWLQGEPLIGAPDFYTAANQKYHRLCWFQGRLYYDFPIGSSQYNTLVYEGRTVNGWECFDIYFGVNTEPITRYSEVAANNLKVNFGGVIENYSGSQNDAGTFIKSRFVTKADDAGDPRAQKLYGDLVMDINPEGCTVTVNVLGAYHTTVLATSNFTGVGRGNFPPIDLGLVQAPELPVTATTVLSPSGSFAATGGQGLTQASGSAKGNQPAATTAVAGLGALSQTIGLDVSWTNTLVELLYGPTLYQFTPSWVPKPEITKNRATDKTDDGWCGSKYLRGFILEGNTLGVTRRFNVLLDGVIANPAPFSVNMNGQIEVPFAMVPPEVGQEFQIQPDASDSSTVGWALFQVRWIWDKWPDQAQIYSSWMNAGSSGSKFMQGFILPLDTGGQPVEFVIQYTDSPLSTPQSVTVGPFTTPANEKTPVPISFTTPFICDQLQIQPQSPCRPFYDDIDWRWEPAPEIAKTWTTQQTNHDIPGYHSGRDAYMAYIGNGSDQPQLSITTVAGTVNYALPSSNGVYTRYYLPLLPQKARYRSYSITSTNGIRLFKKDCSIGIVAWAGQGVQYVQPFGDNSRADGARI